MFKSIKTGVLAVILVGTALLAQAQKKLNEGTITYTVAYELNPEQKALGIQLPPETQVQFIGSMIRIEMEQGPAKLTLISDAVLRSGIMLVDVPMFQKKYAVKTSKEDTELLAGKTPVLSDFKATGEKQKIGDYMAEKYTYRDENGVSYELWATQEILLPDGVSGSEFRTFGATPVKFIREINGMKASLTLKSVVEEKIPAISAEIPSSYEVTDFDTLKALGGQ